MDRIYSTIAILMLALMLGGVAAYAFWPRTADQFAQCTSGAVAGGDLGGPFELVSETGETVTDEQVIDKPALIYFGYTFCPDVCPLDAVRNAEAVDLLTEKGQSVKPVFISIDPERDTPEVLAEYTDAMHPDMLGLTGSPEQVKAASQAYRTFYRRQPGDDEFYLVDHSTFTYLVLPEFGFVDFFRRDATAEDIAERTSCFLAASG